MISKIQKLPSQIMHCLGTPWYAVKLEGEAKRTVITTFSSVLWDRGQRGIVVGRNSWSFSGIGKSLLLRLSGGFRFVCYIMMFHNLYCIFWIGHMSVEALSDARFCYIAPTASPITALLFPSSAVPPLAQLKLKLAGSRGGFLLVSWPRNWFLCFQICITMFSLDL